MTKPIAPLEGQRILQLVPAEAGWRAWFNLPDDGMEFRSVACWAFVETQEENARGVPVSRKHEVVPFVCNGLEGMTDATVELGYAGLSGPGEETSERIKKLGEARRAFDIENPEETEDEPDGSEE